MNVMTIARSIGLVSADRREVSGTIDEAVVLAAISELATASRGNDDLFADAAMRVRLARSAGVVHARPDQRVAPFPRQRRGAPALPLRDGGRLHRPGHRHRPP